MNTQTYFALDYGVKRVGLAFASSVTNIAFPLVTLDRSVKAVFFENFAKVVEEYKPSLFLLGLPLHADGSPSTTSVQVKNFAASLHRRYPTMPIYYINELLSSYEAEDNLRQAGLGIKKIKEVVDQQAAVRILESYLNGSPASLAFEN